MSLPKKKKILFVSLVGIIFLAVVVAWIIFLFTQQPQQREVSEQSSFQWEKVEEAFGEVKQSIQELSIILGGDPPLEE